MKNILTLIVILIYLNSSAQKHTIDTDKPDQTDGTHVVAAGELQIESDVYFNEIEDEYPSIISSSLIRIGLVESWELRLVVEEGIQRDVFIQETTQGIFPFAAGAKAELLKNHWWLPDISFIGLIQIPVISRNEENKMRWASFGAVAYEKEFGKISLDVNTGVKSSAFNKDHCYQGSGSLRYDLSERLMFFLEYFGELSQDGIPKHNADTGIIFFVKKNFQFSASAGTSILSDKFNRFMLVGMGYNISKEKRAD